jgi:DNA gyrase subunit A
MATNMPPHNLSETINAILLRLENPKCSIEEIMKELPGPDFPTYANILGTRGIRSMYETGRGSIVMQAKTAIEPMEGGRSVIVVSEIPYQVNKTTLIQQIADIIRNKKNNDIGGVEDYSDRRGMRVEIIVKRDGNPNKALNYLYKHTSLRTSFGAILLSLVDGVPRTAPITICWMNTSSTAEWSSSGAPNTIFTKPSKKPTSAKAIKSHEQTSMT